MEEPRIVWARHLPPTKLRGARMVAFSDLTPGGKVKPLDDCTIVSFQYDNALSLQYNYWAVAHLLCSELGWGGELSGGSKEYPGRTRRFIHTG